MANRDRQSNYLTNYLDSSSGQRRSWRPYLYVLFGLVALWALVALVGFLLWLV